MKSHLKLILKILVSVALLAFVFHTTGIEKTFQELSASNLWYVPLGVMIYVVGQGVSAYRWKILASALNFRLSFREYYDYYLIGMYFNLFLPSAIGGDVGKMFYLAKSSGRKKREALLTLIAERGFGLAALMVLTSLICLTPVVSVLPRVITLGLVALSLMGFLMLFILRQVPLELLIAKVPKLSFMAVAQVYWRDIPLMVRSTLISVVFHLMMVTIHILIGDALGVHLPVFYLATVYCLVSLVSVIPITFNGIGLRDWTYQYLLMKAGLPADKALAFALYWFLISTLTSLVGGLVLMKGHYQTPSETELSENE